VGPPSLIQAGADNTPKPLWQSDSHRGRRRFQPEGDRLNHAPVDTIRRFLNLAKYPVIVKEVGQGMGPASLRELFKLPLAAVEFAAFGGTNFARVELLRGSTESHQLYEPYTHVGETGYHMVEYVNAILGSEPNTRCREVIVSGGIKNFLDGYYLISKLNTVAVYGQASGFLQYAKINYEALKQYCENQVNGLKLAYAYLTVNK
jgi:isopentenyl-diphosphate delta-isomerase